MGLRTIYIILLVVFGGCANYFGQSPEVNCVSVAPNGNVTVNWTPSINLTPVFVQYNIYSNASGSFIQEGTVTNVNSSVFVHAGAGANVNVVDYYVTAVYDNGSSNVELPPLDTLSTILLNVSNPTDGTSVLQWNDISDPMSPNNGDYYYIQRQIIPGGWALVDSVLISDANYYRDTISVCSATINYQVYLNNSEGCQSLSSIDGDLFEDLIPPDAPVISSVTVDTASGNALVTWYPSLAPDASSYIILQNIGGFWTIIDTVFGHYNTSYLNTDSNADLLSEFYGIAAFDSCWNGSPPSPNTSPMGTPQKSIFSRTQYNVCATEITVKWNNYVNWSSGVAKYNIYRSDEGALYQLVHTNTSGDTVYTEGVDYNHNYCYVIEAVSGDMRDTAISNIVCRYSNQPPSPNFAYLQSVTVEEGKITVKMHPDQTGITSEIELFRSENGTDYESVYTTSTIAATVTFVDEDAEPNEKVYHYKYTVRDSCDNVILTSNTSNNVLLNVSPDQNRMVNFLQWNAYKNWSGNLLGYEIYRSKNGVYDAQPIATVGSNTLYYEDDIESLINTDADGHFCYYVEAKESVNAFGMQEISSSNVTCADQNSLVFIPNALIIGGDNNHWQPVMSLIDFNSYSCKIYNRLGQIIYTSSTPHDSWDGTHKSDYVPLGVYIYQVTFNAGNGKNYDLWGTITVLR